MLNPNEKIHSWTLIFSTSIDGIDGKGRTLSASELGIDLPDGITGRIDEVIESVYPDFKEYKNV